METNAKKFRFFLIIGLFLGITLWGMLEPVMARDPKIHVLFVWGTKATDTRANVNITKRKFESEMAKIGICEGGPRIASFASYEGENAHPKRILERCRWMAQQAGPDDALFVYILCHGASIDLDRETNKTVDNRIHALSPYASDRDHLEFRTIGIKRSSILKAMRSSQHRLDVLITDSCSAYNENPAIPVPSNIDNARLRLVLLNTMGTINWNSTNPLGGYKRQGEVAIGTEEGTIFSEAFLFVACSQWRESTAYYTQERFFSEVGSALVDVFNDAKKLAMKNGDQNISNTFFREEKQTLTEFNDLGRVSRTWEEKNRVSYSN